MKPKKKKLPSIERIWDRAELTLTKSEKKALVSARAELGVSMNEIIRRSLVLYLCRITPRIAIREGWIGSAGETPKEGAISSPRLAS